MFTCQVCRNSVGNTEYVAKEMLFGLRDSFVYFQCPTCECLQLAHLPTDMSRYYPPSYYSLRPVAEPAVRTGLRRWAQHLRDRFAILDRGLLGRLLYAISPNDPYRNGARLHFPGQGATVASLSPSSRILDVCCRSGALLLALHPAGFRYLQEIDAYLDSDLAYPGGLRICKRSFEDCVGK